MMTTRTAVVALSISLAPIFAAPAAAEEKVDFVTQIQPIFAARCAGCHGEKKAAGKLRLHSADAITAIEKKTVLVAGKPDESELLKRIILPAEDKKRMPKGGDPLPADQIALIKKWIEEGAAVAAVAAVAAPAEAAAPAAEPAKEAPKEQPLPEAPPAPAEAIAKLEAAGATVMPLFGDSALLDVSFARASSPAGDEALAALPAAAEQITWLNLQGAQASAAGWAHLAGLKNLMQIHLEKSTADDATLAQLASLGRLEYINLYGTAVTDAGLEHLKGLKNLRRLYLWQCKISYEAAKALEAATPGLEVNLGWDHPQVKKERLTKELTSTKEAATAAAAQLTSLEQQLEAAKQSKTQTDAKQKQIEDELKALEAPAQPAPEATPPADQAAADKAAADKAAADKAAAEKAAAEKAAADKAAADKAAADKAAADKAAAEKAAAEKAAAEKAAAEKAAAVKAAADAKAAAEAAAAEAKAAAEVAAAKQAAAEKASADAKAAEEAANAK